MISICIIIFFDVRKKLNNHILQYSDPKYTYKIEPQAQDASKNAWILEATWRLVDKRVSARQDTARYQSLIQRLVRAIAASLKGDRRRQAEEAGAKVDTLIGSDPPLHREPCQWLKGWYRAAFVRAPPPARVALERITAERVTSTDTFHPRGQISPFMLSHSRWRTRYLRRTRLSGW